MQLQNGDDDHLYDVDGDADHVYNVDGGHLGDPDGHISRCQCCRLHETSHHDALQNGGHGGDVDHLDTGGDVDHLDNEFAMTSSC